MDVANTRIEIERVLERAGAAQLLTGHDRQTGEGFIGFTLGGRQYKFTLPRRGGKRNAEQLERERWRALLLVVKAKLELVAAGMTTIEREFLAQVVLPDGSILGDAIEPQIAEAYANGAMPRLLPAGPVGHG